MGLQVSVESYKRMSDILKLGSRAVVSFRSVGAGN